MAKPKEPEVRKGWARPPGRAFYHYFERATDERPPTQSLCGRVLLEKRSRLEDSDRQGPNDCPECWRLLKEAR